MPRKGSKLKRRMTGRLPFAYEESAEGSGVTSYAGAPLLAETYRATGACESVRRCVKTRERRRERGLSDEQMVESFALLLAAGGECSDDFEVLRSDAGVEALLGYAPPSPSRGREFLYAFDKEVGGTQAPCGGWLFGPGEASERGPLAGLQEAVGATVEAAGAGKTDWRATIDLDATIVVSENREAKVTYEGKRGYQPVVAYWAERDVILSDEFRDGNVPAGHKPLWCLQKAHAALPGSIKKVFCRADAAAYEQEFLSWCRARQANGDPRVIFAVSADMSRELRHAVERVRRDQWRVYDSDNGYVRLWAEVPYVPSRRYEKKGEPPDRYLAIRIEHEQGELFADGSKVKHFAVVTNDWGGDGAKILRWHRGKAGTVERVHDVLKNELGAGVMPSSKFGANAAWFRLNVLTYNLLSILKRQLPSELHTARPKRLRFQILRRAGEIIRHARRWTLRVAGMSRRLVGAMAAARRKLAALARVVGATGPPIRAPGPA